MDHYWLFASHVLVSFSRHENFTQNQVFQVTMKNILIFDTSVFYFINQICLTSLETISRNFVLQILEA
jgi:hypothetical protein